MVTEQELRDALADAVDDPAAETYTLGLSDRALAEAREDARWRRPMTGRRAGARVRWVPVVAVGSAFAVAAAVGMAALGGGKGSGDGLPVQALSAPQTPPNPVGQEALTEFGAECFDGHGPKLDSTYVWDPATRRYHGVPGGVVTAFHPSPDGKYALVELGMPPQSWAVAGWSDAVAGRLTQHPVAGVSGLHWTADGKEVVTDLKRDVAKTTGGSVLPKQAADFYDPASGRRLAAVPIPQVVLDMDASRQWSIQQVQGDHDSAVFPLLSADGDRLEYLDAQGATIRTLEVRDGLPASEGKESDLLESAQISPDGRYLLETSGSVLAVFDLQARGERVGYLDVAGHTFSSWVGDHQIVTSVEKNMPPSGARTGHNPVYSVLSPELKVLQQAEFVLPSDPHGYCATWPMSWAPTGQFPGAFVP